MLNFLQVWVSLHKVIYVKAVYLKAQIMLAAAFRYSTFDAVLETSTKNNIFLLEYT